MKRIITVFALVLALILAATAFADAPAHTLDETKADGTLKIGVFSDKKPWRISSGIRNTRDTSAGTR